MHFTTYMQYNVSMVLEMVKMITVLTIVTTLADTHETSQCAVESLTPEVKAKGK